MALVMTLLMVPTTYGAALTSVSDTVSRQTASIAANHTISFVTPTGVAASGTVSVTFPAGFTTTGVVFGDVDMTDNGTDVAIAGTPTGATWGAAVAGQVLTLTNGSAAITAGHTLVIEIGTHATFGVTGTHQVVNPTAGTYVVTLTAGASDSGSVAEVFVANDQVTLSASVDPSITFSVSANSSPFGTLSTGSVTTSSPNITLTIGTNANAGYTLSVSDQGNGTVGGLYSGTANIVSATATLAAGSEGYGIKASSGTATITAPYNGSGNSIGQLQRTAQSLATYSTSTTSNQTVVVTHMAAISASTKAGTYNDTLTYIVTGNF
jgi:hypothetical protein